MAAYFLGLNGTVVKSHGAADATGVSAAVKLAFQLAQTALPKNSPRGLHLPRCLIRMRDRRLKANGEHQ